MHQVTTRRAPGLCKPYIEFCESRPLQFYLKQQFLEILPFITLALMSLEKRQDERLSRKARTIS